jgi:cell division protein DivIC
LTKKQKKNITHLNEYSINKTLDMIRQSKRKKFVRIRTGIILGVGLVLIGIAGLPLIGNTQKTDEFNQLHAEAASQLENLEQEQKELEYQVGLLEDEEYVAKLAREELNLSKPDEILINLPEEEAIDSENADSENNTIEENESE